MNTEHIESQKQHLYTTKSDLENRFATPQLNNTVNQAALFSTDEIESPYKRWNPIKEDYETVVATGRVTNIGPDTKYPQFQLFQENHKGTEDNFYDSLSGIMENSIVAKVFFSGKNITNLHNRIVEGVFRKSGGKIRIGRQSDTELKIIMRSIFLQLSSNAGCKIQEQVKTLNKYVLDYAVDNVLVGAVGQANFIRDITKPMEIRPNPQNTNIKGVNTAMMPNHFI